MVPVEVFDTGREGLAPPGSDWRIAEKDFELMVVRGLNANDFRLKQDGVEQKIEAVSFEPVPVWNYKDRFGFHSETVGPGEGRWMGPPWDPDRAIWVNGTPRYILSYRPPESPAGSCHSITVHVNRKNVLVYAPRGKYCNLRHSALDPLRGTTLGRRMEQDLLDPKPGNFEIEVAATAVFTGSGKQEVHVTVGIPWRSLRPSSEEGILGVVYSGDHSVVVQFSDAANIPRQVPVRYETQFSLSPGTYTLQVDFRDGRKFGRSEIPVSVESEPQTGPGLSGIAFCRRVRAADSAVLETRSVRDDVLPKEPSGGFHALIGGDLECIPATTQVFGRGAPVYAYFEVYAPMHRGGAKPSVEAHVKISDCATGVIVVQVASLHLIPFIHRGDPLIRVASEPFVNRLAPGPVSAGNSSHGFIGAEHGLAHKQFPDRLRTGVAVLRPTGLRSV